MARTRRLRFPDSDVAFWLLVGLAVVLLTSISTTVADDRPALLLRTLARDLGALQAQLEQPAPDRGAVRVTAFNAELGDGGMTFRHQAAHRLARIAQRRADALQKSYAAAEDWRRARLAASIWLHLHRLERELAGAGDEASAESALTRLQRELAALLEAS